MDSDFIQLIRLLLTVIERRNISVRGNSRMVASTAAELAKLYGLEKDQAKNIYLAGLLLDIGKAVIPDILLNTPYDELSLQQRSAYRAYVNEGDLLLGTIDALEPARKILSLQTRTNNILSEDINCNNVDVNMISAQIVGLASYYHNMYNSHPKGSVTKEIAIRNIKALSGIRFTASIVDTMVEGIENNRFSTSSGLEKKISIDMLAPGMTLSRDLYNSNGILLYPKGQVINRKKMGSINHQIENKNIPVFIVDEPNS